MTVFKKIFIILTAITVLSSCQSSPQPSVIPAIQKPVLATHNLPIIGEVEPIYFPPIKTPVSARIDTGAEQSSLDADNIKYFERDGEKWISFDLINRESGERYNFKKEIERHTNIKRIHLTEKRPVVKMDVKFGDETFTANFSLAKRNFSLAKRDKFEYQALIGRNILTGRAIVDTSIANTLH